MPDTTTTTTTTFTNTSNNDNNGDDEAIVPFKVDIPQSEVDRLKRKLADTRLPPREIVPGAGDKYGQSTSLSTHPSIYHLPMRPGPYQDLNDQKLG
jgi:hypothetical protein